MERLTVLTRGLIPFQHPRQMKPRIAAWKHAADFRKQAGQKLAVSGVVKIVRMLQAVAHRLQHPRAQQRVRAAAQRCSRVQCAQRLLTAAKLFTVAGPVLVFGISASVVYGLVYYFLL